MSETPEKSPDVDLDSAQPTGADDRYPELTELQEEIQRRIRNNQRFLERFMDEDFEDEESAGEDDEPSPEDFEEL